MVAEHGTNGIAAVIAFGLPPRVVNGLIEEFIGSGITQARWFVFEPDMEALRALNEVWKGVIEIVLCGIPPSYASEVVDAAVEVLLHENVSLRHSAWLQASSLSVLPPPQLGLVLSVGDSRVSDLQAVACRVLDWMNGGTAPATASP
jgi:hypothetical protein